MQLMRKQTLFPVMFVLMILIFNLPAHEQVVAQTTATMNATDNLFLADAYLSNIAEVQLAQVAVQQATNENVRQFAQQMIDEHTTAHAQLVEIAANKSVTFSACMSDISGMQISLRAQPGSNSFDLTYIRGQILAHQRSLDLFRHEAGNGNDADLRAYANTRIPSLHEHLQLARRILRNLRAQGSAAQQ